MKILFPCLNEHIVILKAVYLQISTLVMIHGQIMELNPSLTILATVLCVGNPMRQENVWEIQKTIKLRSEGVHCGEVGGSGSSRISIPPNLKINDLYRTQP